MQILRIVLPLLALASVVAAVYFFSHALRVRKHVGDRAYGVERQEARQGMFVAFSRGILASLLALVFLAVFGLSGQPEAAAPDVLPTSRSSPTAQPLPSIAVQSQTPAANDAPPASPTAPLERPTDTPAPSPSPSATASVPTAVVNSPNGLWLREAPGGTQEVELIADGTVLTLLAGRETVDGVEWQEVRTPAGNEGWVAAEFLILQ